MNRIFLTGFNIICIEIRDTEIQGTRQKYGTCTDFKTNRYMSPISGNESLDFELVHK
jgi:hypothetical protein